MQGPRAAARDRRRARRALRAAGRRRGRPHPRRRQLRGSAPVQRRAASSARSPRARVPVVSAVGHEQDTPLCDLAADVRASTPTAAGKLVVPELTQLSGQSRPRPRVARARRPAHARTRPRSDSARTGERLRAAPRLALERERGALERTHERLRRAPALAVERKRAALETTAGKLAALSPQQHFSEDTRSSGRTRSSSPRRADVAPGAASTSRSPKAASARAWRRST